MGDFVLEIVEGQGEGRQIPVDGRVELGRDATADVSIDDAQVSRHHARVVVEGGQPVVEDLGSTNGTYVNDQPVMARRPISLGDRVRVGLTVIELRGAAEAAQATSIAPKPDITRLGQDALGPQPEQVVAVEDRPAGQEDRPPAAPFATEESEPAFVPREVLGDEQAESDYTALAGLIDRRVKHRSVVAAYAVFAIGAIAVIVFFALLYQ